MRLIAASCFDARYAPGPGTALLRAAPAYLGMRKARTSPMRAIPKKERRWFQWPVKGILSVHFYNYIISLVEVGFPGPVSSISSAFP